MIFEQCYLGCLSQASYFIAERAAGVAVVVDPRRDTSEYLELAKQHDVQIKHVILTHFHADFVAGHLELVAQTGAALYLGSKAQADFEFSPLADGDELKLGSVRLSILETPGHTPESISIQVFDDSRSSTIPHAVLTGDALFIGDVGRPDLMASKGASADELASDLYDSLRTKLLPLDDSVLVYPAHGAGSACGKNMSKETFSTLGHQRANNYALQPMERAKFVELVTEGQAPAPAYFAHDAELNRSERPLLDDVLARALQPLSLDELRSLADSGAQVLDVRDPESFAASHWPGSINVGLGGRFASWAGSVLDTRASIVVIADPGSEREAVTRLARVGLDDICGYLEGGPESIGVAMSRVSRVNPNELRVALDSEDAPLVLDVRTLGEWESGHIDGALHVPLAQLQQRIDEVPKQRLVVACAGGYRSMIAASLLEQAGHTELTDLRGGMNAFTAVAAS